MKKTTKPSQNPNRQERYTPAEYVPLIRRVLGEIELDPASCAEANKVIQAKNYYSIAEDGLTRPWFGNVYLNPPYKNMRKWVDKLLVEFNGKTIDQVILLSNPSTDTSWFAWLCSRYNRTTSVFCCVEGRIEFPSPDETLTVNQPRSPSMFTYLGDNKTLFHDVFSSVGQIIKPVFWPSELS
jgi:ParB family transcriptional regulator, chromosome partitioning protein